MLRISSGFVAQSTNIFSVTSRCLPLTAVIRLLTSYVSILSFKVHSPDPQGRYDVHASVVEPGALVIHHSVGNRTLDVC